MTDYLYATGRLRALEHCLIGNDQLCLLLEAKNTDELFETLRQSGIETDEETWEELLSTRLRDAYCEVRDICGNDAILRLWLYPYDCNNVKAAIKGFIRSIDPRSMMVEFGNVSVEDVTEMVRMNDFSRLSPAMCAAAAQAVEEYAKTQNPQVIDLTLDRACYEDMLAAAKESGVALCLALVQMKIDLINLLTCIRIQRMRNGEIGRLLFEQAWLEGGTLSQEWGRECFAGGEAYLWSSLIGTAYEALAEAVDGERATLTAIEREADNLFMERVRTVQYVSFGQEIPMAYLLAYEYEVRNLRIIIAGKRAMLAPQVIRERIRQSYV